MEIKIEDIQRKQKGYKKISIEITKDTSDWMREKNISPTALFNSAIKELKAKEK